MKNEESEMGNEELRMKNEESRMGNEELRMKNEESGMVYFTRMVILHSSFLILH